MKDELIQLVKVLKNIRGKLKYQFLGFLSLIPIFLIFSIKLVILFIFSFFLMSYFFEENKKKRKEIIKNSLIYQKITKNKIEHLIILKYLFAKWFNDKELNELLEYDDIFLLNFNKKIQSMKISDYLEYIKENNISIDILINELKFFNIEKEDFINYYNLSLIPVNEKNSNKNNIFFESLLKLKNYELNKSQDEILTDLTKLLKLYVVISKNDLKNNDLDLFITVENNIEEVINTLISINENPTSDNNNIFISISNMLKNCNVLLNNILINLNKDKLKKINIMNNLLEKKVMNMEE